MVSHHRILQSSANLLFRFLVTEKYQRRIQEFSLISYIVHIFTYFFIHNFYLDTSFPINFRGYSVTGVPHSSALDDLPMNMSISKFRDIEYRQFVLKSNKNLSRRSRYASYWNVFLFSINLKRLLSALTTIKIHPARGFSEMIFS